MLFIIKECRFLGVLGGAKRVCLWVFVEVHELYMPRGLQGSPCGLWCQKDPVVSLSCCSLVMGSGKVTSVLQDSIFSSAGWR